jgi:hypothetical protein
VLVISFLNKKKGSDFGMGYHSRLQKKNVGLRKTKKKAHRGDWRLRSLGRFGGGDCSGVIFFCCGQRDDKKEKPPCSLPRVFSAPNKIVETPKQRQNEGPQQQLLGESGWNAAG